MDLRGDDTALLDEMDRARVDLFPAFSGELLTSLAPKSTVTSPDPRVSVTVSVIGLPP